MYRAQRSTSTVTQKPEQSLRHPDHRLHSLVDCICFREIHPFSSSNGTLRVVVV